MASCVKLRDVVAGNTGSRNPTKAPDESFVYVDVAAVDNGVKTITGARPVLGSDAPSRARKLIRRGDVLVSTVRPNLNAVAMVPPDLDVVEAGHWDLPQDRLTVEQAVESLLSQEGLDAGPHGTLALAATDYNVGMHGASISASPPMLLHPEGLTAGNRLSVLSVSGGHRFEHLPQPESDWALRAGCLPFDSINELSIEYGLGPYRGDLAQLEVVAQTSVEVSLRSAVQGTAATIGIWMPKGLDKAKTRIGYRVLDKGSVALRGSVGGANLTWEEEADAFVGLAQLDVPLGSVMQCIAVYDEHAHHVRWFADPSVFQNPRTAVLSLVDQSGQLLRAYLFPDLPPKGKAADDFEAAIGWLLWALGFAPANFGLNAKTRDSFDTIAVSPRGDFLIAECTLGLLRAESKLSRLAARAASLRELLDASNMRHVRILPVIITAMTREQVKPDLAQAESARIIVVARESLEEILNETLRFPDADGLFERAIQSLQPNKLTGTAGT